MKEMINNIGDRMVTKMRIINHERRDGGYSDNFRKFPIYSEWVGMTQLLKAMEMDYYIDYDETVTYMTAITIMGTRFEV